MGAWSHLPVDSQGARHDQVLAYPWRRHPGLPAVRAAVVRTSLGRIDPRLAEMGRRAWRYSAGSGLVRQRARRAGADRTGAGGARIVATLARKPAAWTRTPSRPAQWRHEPGRGIGRTGPETRRERERYPRRAPPPDADGASGYRRFRLARVPDQSGARCTAGLDEATIGCILCRNRHSETAP